MIPTTICVVQDSHCRAYYKTCMLCMELHMIFITLAAIQFNASGSISEDNFTISLSATVDGVFECSLDGGSYQACKWLRSIRSHMCVILLLYTYFIGSSGDVFQNLSFGSHTMNVRFTPHGYCQALMGEISLNFTRIMTSKSSNQ